jgi:hypothetical protein
MLQAKATYLDQTADIQAHFFGSIRSAASAAMPADHVRIEANQLVCHVGKPEFLRIPAN